MKPPVAEIEERAVLGSMMLDYDTAVEIATVLSPEDFFQPQNKAMAEVCFKTVASGRVPTMIDLMGQLKDIVPLNVIMEITGEVYTAAYGVEYAKKVADASYCRRAMKEFVAVLRTAESGDAPGVTEAMQKAVMVLTSSRKQTNFRSLKEWLIEAYEDIERATKCGGMTGIHTGFSSLDRATGGWQASDLVIIAARPGMGKTSLLMHTAMCGAEKEKGWGVFSLEMGGKQLGSRMLSNKSSVNAFSMRTGKVKDDEWPKLIAATSALSELPIYVDDTPGLSIGELRARARLLKNQKNIQGIMVDYLQLASDEGVENRAIEISNVARGLKNMAKELDVPVLAAAQLSRSCENRQDKRPMLSDLKESGGIEEAADMVAFIYRDDYYNADSPTPGISEIIIAKHRNGPTLTVELGWQAAYTRFVELERRYEND